MSNKFILAFMNYYMLYNNKFLPEELFFKSLKVLLE